MFNLNIGERNAFKIKGGKNNGKVVKINTEKDKGDFNELIVEDGSIQQVPSYKDRDTLFICAPSGAGKSTYLASYAKEYKRKYPNNNLVLISPKEDDEVLNQLNPIRIRLDDENFVDPDTKIDLDELEKSLVMFDDICAIADDDVKKGVMELRDRLLTLGRSKKISTAITSHMITNHKETRVPLIESQFLVFFPGGGLTYQSNNFMKRYCGLSNKQVQKINSTPSRWICFHKNYPMYVLAKDCAYTV